MPHTRAAGRSGAPSAGATEWGLETQCQPARMVRPAAAVYSDGPRRAPLHARDQAQQGGLAASRCACQSLRTLLVDGKAGTVHDVHGRLVTNVCEMPVSSVAGTISRDRRDLFLHRLPLNPSRRRRHTDGGRFILARWSCPLRDFGRRNNRSAPPIDTRSKALATCLASRKQNELSAVLMR
jgi:hypothetical protein